MAKFHDQDHLPHFVRSFCLMLAITGVGVQSAEGTPKTRRSGRPVDGLVRLLMEF
jgi:hypothetical protein